MNKLMWVAALSGVVGGAAAQMAPVVDEVRISRPLVRIELPAERRNVWVNEFEQIMGSYHLSNGKNMQLSMWGNRMYAKIDGMPKAQLVAAAPYVFVALDEKMKITIDDQEVPGRILAEVLLVTPRLSGNTTDEPVTRLIASR